VSIIFEADAWVAPPAIRSPKDFEVLRASVRQLTTEVAATHAADVDRQARFPAETLVALRKAHVLSAAVPSSLGGAGCTLSELAQLCSTLAQGCGSSAMVLAMHFIQVGCIARHGQNDEFFKNYLRELVKHQYLLGSMTSEVGTYGDTRSSICSVERTNDGFILNKDATTGSYCGFADGILVTTRRDRDAAANDQVLVLVRRDDCTLEQTTSWDTLGMRGTCSPGFRMESSGSIKQIIPGPFADSSSRTMVPYSHILWASLWWGIAADAVAKAANFVRSQARDKPGTIPPTATRLAEVSMQLETMKNNWQSAAQAFDAMGPDATSQDQLSSMSWALRMNNLKMSCSEAAPQIVHRALQIVGIMGYKNDSPLSLGRQYRDALSGSLMISNDRIAAKSASMLLVHKDVA
jgi:acyl-CoA dehydrogenase